MKSTFAVFFTIVFTMIIVSSCGGNVKNDMQNNSEIVIDDDYYAFKGFSLKPYDIPVMIMLPDETSDIGASTKPEIIHEEDDFKWELKLGFEGPNGSNYHMCIDDWGDYTDMVETRKKELKELDFYKIRYIIDEKDFILYEQTLMAKGKPEADDKVFKSHKSYHVYAQKVIDGVTYVFRSSDDGFIKSYIELMAKSIKSVKQLKS